MISVGINVAKEKSTVCVLRPYGEIVKSPSDVPHDESAVQNLIDELRAINGELRITMKATDTYHLPLLQQLKAAGFFVCVINPLAMKRYAASEIRKAKTDKLDAARIANYGIDHWLRLEEYQPPEAVYEELRLLGRQYYQWFFAMAKTRVATMMERARQMAAMRRILFLFFMLCFSFTFLPLFQAQSHDNKARVNPSLI